MTIFPQHWKRWVLVCGTAVIWAATAPAQQPRLDPNVRLERQSRLMLPDSVVPQANPEHDLGPMDSARVIHGVSLYFRRTDRQQAELDQLLLEQQTPGSPNYRKWLTPGQFADRFALSQQDIDKVASWLQAQGLTVDPLPAGRDHISFTGTVAQINAALGADMHHYSFHSETHFANSNPLSLPADLAGVVLSVRHLNDFHWKAKGSFSQTPHLTSTISGNTFLVPDDVATIYGLNALYNLGFHGEGRTVVVAGRTDIDQTNIDAFRSATGLPPTNLVKTLVPNSGVAMMKTSAGELNEAYLDIEWAGGVAKNATVNFVFVGNDPNKDVDDAVIYAINNNLAPVISVSFGLCEVQTGTANAMAFQAKAQQANAQGQTIVVASGDTGAADCEDNSKGNVSVATHGLAVDIPAAVPEVTGIGGSSFSADLGAATQFWLLPNQGAPFSASARGYIGETAWNDSVAQGSLSSGGGGASTIFPKPAWQPNTGVQGDKFRFVPDLSLSASPVHDSYLICSQGSCVNGLRRSDGTLNPVGGTSAGAPSFAGMLTVMEQAMNSSGEGNINLAMYAVAADPVAYGSAFHDITTGNNQVACSTTPDCVNGILGFAAGPGFDLATGLGSLDAYNLEQALGSTLAPGGATTLTTTSLQSSTTTPANGANFILTATVTPPVSQGYMNFAANGHYDQTQVPVQNGQAQFSPSITALNTGYNSLVATYYPNGANFAGSSSLPVQVIVQPDTVTAPGALALNISPASIVLPASGGSQNSTMLVTGRNSFSGSVGLSCAVTFNSGVAKVLPTCVFSQSNLSLSVMQDTANSQVTITVPAAIVGQLQPSPLNKLLGLGSAATFGVVFFALPGTGKRRRNKKGVSWLVLGTFTVAIAGFATGCAGLARTSATPAPVPVNQVVPGAYSVVLTATPNVGSPQTITMNLTVQ